MLRLPAPASLLPPLFLLLLLFTRQTTSHPVPSPVDTNLIIGLNVLGGGLVGACACLICHACSARHRQNRQAQRQATREAERRPSEIALVNRAGAPTHGWVSPVGSPVAGNMGSYAWSPTSSPEGSPPSSPARGAAVDHATPSAPPAHQYAQFTGTSPPGIRSRSNSRTRLMSAV